MSGSTKKKYCKLLHAITNHALLSVAEELMQEEEVKQTQFEPIEKNDQSDCIELQVHKTFFYVPTPKLITNTVVLDTP